MNDEVLRSFAMSQASEAGAMRWRKMADEARTLAIRMRDPLSRQRMFELAASYEKLADALNAEREVAAAPNAPEN
jgi:hypothetical protein